MDTGKIGLYWANTSSNRLADKLIREGSSDVKIVMEDFLNGKAFHAVIDDWFAEYTPHYNKFVNALLSGKLKEMNIYMNKVASNSISYFDTGNRPLY